MGGKKEESSRGVLVLEACGWLGVDGVMITGCLQNGWSVVHLACGLEGPQGLDTLREVLSAVEHRHKAQRLMTELAKTTQGPGPEGFFSFETVGWPSHLLLDAFNHVEFHAQWRTGVIAAGIDFP
jgi:hypothetical protein